MSEPHFFADVRAAMGTTKPAAAATNYTPGQFAGEIPPYAQAALTAETMAVAAAPAGTRNDTLNIAAVKLGSLVAGGHLPPALVLQELTAAAEAAGLEPTEIRATLNSGLRKGEQQPRTIPDTDKETEQWLNDVTTGQAPRSGSANGSTPGQPPRDGGPTPENGTQPPTSSSTPSPTFDPWAQPAGPGGSLTAGPSSFAVLPWEKPRPSNVPSTPHALTAEPPPGTTEATAAAGITNTGPASTTHTATDKELPWNPAQPAAWPQQNTAPGTTAATPTQQTPGTGNPAGSAGTAQQDMTPGILTGPNPNAAPWTPANATAAAATAPNPLQPPPGILARETALELLRLESRAAAQRMFQQQNGAPVERPRAESLTALLAEDDEPVQYRISDLLPAGGRVLLAAQYKAGKTTMVANMVKAIADNEPFLGTYYTEPSTRITVIDDEMSKQQIRRWYRDHEIKNTDSVKIVSLRGALTSFDILDPVTRQLWAQELHGTEILVLDCLRPVLDALGLDENKDGGKFLVAFDSLLAEIGASEAVVVHHMGHAGGRARGDSRILDWPDAVWNMTREETEDSKSPRYFSAHGRDVNESEKLLNYYEDEARALRVTGGDRRQSSMDTATQKIVDLITVQPHLSGRAIQTALGGNRKINTEALNRAVSAGLLVRYTGPKNAYLYTLKNPAAIRPPSDTSDP